MDAYCDVLVVDDDPLIKEVVAHWVGDGGHAVHMAENAVQALQLLQAVPAILAMVTDMRLPVIAGGQLIDEALKLRPDLRIVAMTGYADSVAAPDGIEIIEKPFAREKLEQALARACAKPARSA